MNKKIAELLLKAASQSDDKYRADAFRKGARVIKELDFEIKSVDQVKGLPYIGEGIRRRISEILKTGTLSELTDDTSELLSVLGIGKSKAKELSSQGITTVSQLRKAAKSGQVKLTRAQTLGLKYYKKLRGNIPRSEIKIMEKILYRCTKRPNVHIILCGSYRRGKETSNDIDVLMWTDDVKTLSQIEDPKTRDALDEYVYCLEASHLLMEPINEDYSTLYMGFAWLGDRPIRRIDIRWIPKNSLPAAMLYFTGPYELNQHMRRIAKSKGMLLNEHGLYKLKKVKGHEIKVEVPIKTEADIFKALGMDYLEPSERESFNSNTRKNH